MMDYKQIGSFLRFTIRIPTLFNLTNEELVCLYKECLVMAEFVEDLSLILECHFSLGILYTDTLCRYQDAKESFEQALRVALLLDDKETICWMYCNLENVCRWCEEYDDALKYCNKVLNLFSRKNT